MNEQQGVNPIESLAFAMYTQPGVYALLLGSGVSRSAGIPTGWEVLQDLISKLAASRGLAQPDHPLDWYRETHGTDANYPDMLEQLGTTPADRKSILRSYFEPTDYEREQGLKQPTEAHSAIAELVVGGYVKIIVTTNFDRLVENALRQAGIEPVVLSTPPQFDHAEPLTHMKCCVIKLHGDYLAPDTLNTVSELSEYPKATRATLRRVLEEYGLVVCGWSADWDNALRDNLKSINNGLYSTYWHVFGGISEQSESCIRERSASRIDWGDADQLFSRLRDHVLALREYAMQPPQNDELAVATFKRLLPDARYRIRLRDYIKDLVEEVSEASIQITPPSLVQEVPRRETVEPKIAELESVSTKLVNCAFVAGQWLELEHIEDWHQAFHRLVYCETSPQHVSEWHSLREFPAVLVLHALSTGAVLAQRYAALGKLFHLRINQVPLTDDRIAHVPEWVHSVLDRRFTPTFSLYERVFEYTHRTLLDSNYFAGRFSSLFSEAEVLQVLAQAPFGQEYSGSVPLGRFMLPSLQRESEDILRKIRDSINVLEAKSPYVTSAIFGDTPELCLEHLDDLTKHLPVIRQKVWFQR